MTIASSVPIPKNTPWRTAKECASPGAPVEAPSETIDTAIRPIAASASSGSNGSRSPRLDVMRDTSGSLIA